MSFVENPMFWPEMVRGVGNALEDKTATIRDRAKTNTTHPSVARRITARPVKVDSEGPYGTVTTGGGLGNIFEGGTKQRQTKSGANRGSITAERAIERAVESEVLWDLDLHRYL